ALAARVPRVAVLSSARAGLRRELPSFPTRRSSDLRATPHVTAKRARGPGTPGIRSPDGCCGPVVSSTAPVVMRTILDGERMPGRSEEHTSELQSRENLVCRLLLEKKKKTREPSAAR